MPAASNEAALAHDSEVIRSDPQLHTLTCLVCCVVQKSQASLANHIRRSHPDLQDFPVLLKGRSQTSAGSAEMYKIVLKEIDFFLYSQMKFLSVQGRIISASKRIRVSAVCPPVAFDSLIQLFALKARWAASGTLIVDGATGETLQTMLGWSSLRRNFCSYSAVIDLTEPVKMKWAAKLIKTDQGVCCREIYFLSFLSFVNRI